MSSWKKVAKLRQTPHRERHQPEKRSHLGLLNKNKDYKEKARNHAEKKRALKILQKRALNKNPDEFYFHMVNSRVQDGEHIEFSKDDKHTDDQIKLMQTRDIKYVNMKRTIEFNKINKLKGEMHLIDSADKIPNQHIFFVDDEKEVKNFDVVKHLNTHPDLMHRKSNRPHLSMLDEIVLPDIDEKTIQLAAKTRNAKYSELGKRIQREKQLSIVQQKLELKRHLLSKKEGRKERIKPGTKEAAPIYKWKFQRKR